MLIRNIATNEIFEVVTLEAIKGGGGGGGEGGAEYYADLKGKPSLNGVTISGAKNQQDYKLNIPITLSFTGELINNELVFSSDDTISLVEDGHYEINLSVPTSLTIAKTAKVSFVYNNEVLHLLSVKHNDTDNILTWNDLKVLKLFESDTAQEFVFNVTYLSTSTGNKDFALIPSSDVNNTWGYITGSIANQADLKIALDSKIGSSNYSTASKGGTVKTGNGFDLIPSGTNAGIAYAVTRTKEQFDEDNNSFFVSKGTLNNVLDANNYITQIKTINNQSLIGEGNIEIQGGGGTSGANVDLSNLSDTGKINSANLAMPSATKQINLTLPANDSTITAPADGYVLLKMDSTTSYNAQRIGLLSRVSQVTAFPNFATNVRIFVPVRKGATVRIAYTSGTNTSTAEFRFIYATGSESEGTV